MDPESLMHKIRHESMVKVYLGVLLFLGATAGLIFHIQHESLKTPRVDQCALELETTKKKLEVETDYKKRLEKLLADTQEYYEADREQFKTSMDNCFALTEQSVLCQKNLNDANIRCNKIRAQYEKARKQLQDIKCSKIPT